MTAIEEKVRSLRRSFRAFGERVVYDTDKRGRDFATLTMPNENNSKFPLTLMMYEDGDMYISLGICAEAVYAKGEDEAKEIIEKVLSDGVYFTCVYSSEKDFDVCRTCMGRVDNDENEYRAYIASLEKPLRLAEKLFGHNVGIFETTNFSGGAYRVIKRL